ncbi:hypothetical protein RHGRI_009321 [Rhododendron griersonianum]|uniref:CCHC-type domain-containing protein n=1 Tax=Rhododendron griersonianum TaxID=479676 RepID=A0AAV6KES5_9ERIC|nr:hypothetical protein RHGRI_009321 [Rhododendron griersonianum]
MVARYISGLTTTIQDALAMQTLWTVSEAYNWALVAEKQEKRKFSRFGQQYQGGSKSGQPFYSYSRSGSSSSGGQGVSSGVSTQNRADKASIPAQNQPQSGASGTRNQFQSGDFKCFKCGEPGHKSSDCCKASGGRNKTLFIEEVTEQGCEDDIPVYDEDMDIIGNELDYTSEETKMDIIGNELDYTSEETEVFTIVTHLISQKKMECGLAIIVVQVALERYYSRHDSRFTEPNPFQEQIDNINRSVCLEEKVAIILNTIAHYHKNRVVKHHFFRSGMEKPTKSRKKGGKAKEGGNAEENVADAIRRSWNQREEDALLNAMKEMAESAADMVENLDEAPKEAGGDSTTVSKIDKSPKEHSKKKAKVFENILAGMNNFADKLGIYFERFDAKLEMLGGRMGYAHDLSKRKSQS